MRSRLEARLGAGIARRLTIGTFHAICLSLLDKKPLLGRDEALPLMREALRACGRALDPAEALSAVSRVKCGGTGAEDATALAADYQALLSERGARDLDDLLLDALAHPGRPPRRFTHLLVDEFQDINAVQRRLVLKWHEGGQSLFVIGDADQSITGSAAQARAALPSSPRRCRRSPRSCSSTTTAPRRR